MFVKQRKQTCFYAAIVESLPINKGIQRRIELILKPTQANRRPMDRNWRTFVYPTCGTRFSATCISSSADKTERLFTDFSSAITNFEYSSILIGMRNSEWDIFLRTLMIKVRSANDAFILRYFRWLDKQFNWRSMYGEDHSPAPDTNLLAFMAPFKMCQFTVCEPLLKSDFVLILPFLRITENWIIGVDENSRVWILRQTCSDVLCWKIEGHLNNVEFLFKLIAEKGSMSLEHWLRFVQQICDPAFPLLTLVQDEEALAQSCLAQLPRACLEHFTNLLRLIN